MTMAEKFDWLRVIWLRLKYWWQHKTWENQPYMQSYNGWLRTYGIQWRQNSDITYSIHLLSSLPLSSSILCRSSGGVCGGITGSHYWSHHELDDVIQPHIIVKQRVAILQLCGDTPTIKVETSRQSMHIRHLFPTTHSLVPEPHPFMMLTAWHTSPISWASLSLVLEATVQNLACPHKNTDSTSS